MLSDTIIGCVDASAGVTWAVDWGAVAAIASVVIAAAAIIGLLRSARKDLLEESSKSTKQLDDKLEKLADKHIDLSGDFRELRGEIRARFAIQSKQELNELADSVAKRLIQGAKSE